MADFESLYTRRLDRLLNSNDSNTLFTSTRRQEAINDGCQEFARADRVLPAPQHYHGVL